jgi:hypothetical protein
MCPTRLQPVRIYVACYVRFPDRVSYHQACVSGGSGKQNFLFWINVANRTHLLICLVEHVWLVLSGHPSEVDGYLRKFSRYAKYRKEMSGRPGRAVQIGTTRLVSVLQRSATRGAARGHGQQPGPAGQWLTRRLGHVSVTPAWSGCGLCPAFQPGAYPVTDDRRLTIAGGQLAVDGEDVREQQFPFRPLQQWMETDPSVHGMYRTYSLRLEKYNMFLVLLAQNPCVATGHRMINSSCCIINIFVVIRFFRSGGIARSEPARFKTLWHAL